MTRSHSYLALIAALSMTMVLLPQSFAALQSTSNSSLSLSTGSWSSNVNTATGLPSNSPYSIIWTGSARKQYALVALINNGFFPLNSGHISFTSIKTNGDATTPPTITFESCSGTWNSTTFACSGSITLLGGGTSGTVDINEPTLPSNRLIIRLTNLRDVIANYQTTFNAWSYRTDIRNAQEVTS